MPVGRRILSTHPSTVRSRECRQRYVEEGICSCGKNPVLPGKRQCPICLESSRKTQAKLRRTVIEHYGGKCSCCGEFEYKFLSIDHINGKGNQHRLEVGGNKKSPILRWLIKNNFPKEFQILCHNCNMAKGCYGVCPHKEQAGG
jgi:hypothetical protein